MGDDPPARLDDGALHAGVALLIARDTDLAGIVARHGPPPLWAREPGFATLVHIILEQQVSLRSDEQLAMAEAWRPLRAVAARVLWHAYLAGER